MKIRFNYEFMGRIYPTCMVATSIYYDPADSTLCISDGIDWWECEIAEIEGRNFVDLAFGYDNINLDDYIFHQCK